MNINSEIIENILKDIDEKEILTFKLESKYLKNKSNADMMFNILLWLAFLRISNKLSENINEVIENLMIVFSIMMWKFEISSWKISGELDNLRKNFYSDCYKKQLIKKKEL